MGAFIYGMGVLFHRNKAYLAKKAQEQMLKKCVARY